MDEQRDDPTQPLPQRDFELIAKVRRMDKKLYSMRLFRKNNDDVISIGHLVFRDDEWARLVPGLRAVDVVVDYVEE